MREAQQARYVCSVSVLCADLGRRSGATVFAVLELQYTKRGVLKAELAATYNWAPDGELRPLYEYTWEGPPLAPDDAEDGT